MSHELLHTALLATYGALVLTCAWLALTGRIHLAGMLQGRAGEDLVPERLLLLVVTVGGAFSYVLLALSHDGEAPLKSLPEVPPLLLDAVLAGSAGYLGGKVLRGHHRPRTVPKTESITQGDTHG